MVFRAETLRAALEIYGRLFSFAPGVANVSWQVVVLIAVGFASQFLPRKGYDRALASFAKLPAGFQALSCLLVFHVLRAFTTAQPKPFIYFQF